VLVVVVCAVSFDQPRLIIGILREDSVLANLDEIHAGAAHPPDRRIFIPAHLVGFVAGVKRQPAEAIGGFGIRRVSALERKLL